MVEAISITEAVEVVDAPARIIVAGLIAARPNTSDFETALKSKYSELFKDEGHVIVCFMESSPSVYATYYWAGSAAKGVIDDEAGEILLDVL